jgi:hypothetical protein
VIHRDIKPENILLHDGRPMVADFGIALAVSAAASGRMTETGLSLGTPHYMSPEQATADKEISARSDIYSLASVCYEMLTGEPPHLGKSAQQIIMKIVTEEAAPVTRLRKNVPPNVAAAVARALEKLPADRFATAKEFADALDNPGYTTVTPGRAAAVGGGRRQVSLAQAIGLAVAGVIVGAMAVGLMSRRAAPTGVLERQQLTFEGHASQPGISPDGKRVAYKEFRCEHAGLGPCRVNLMIQEVGATRATALLRGMLDMGPPRWTRDGQAVLLTAALDSARRGLFLVPLATGTPRLLSPLLGAYDVHATADSAVLISRVSSTTALLRIIELSSGRVTDSFPIPFGGVGSVAWSPDGRWFALVGKREYGLYLLSVLSLVGRHGELGGRFPARVRGNAVRWSPDGKSVLAFRVGTVREDDLIRVGAMDGRFASRADVVLPRIPTLYEGMFDVARQAGTLALCVGDALQDLYALQRERSSLTARRLATGTTWYGQAIITADGATVYVLRGDAAGDNVYKIDFATGEQEALTAQDRPGDLEVRLSADERRLVSGRAVGDSMRLDVMELPSGRVRSAMSTVSSYYAEPLGASGLLALGPDDAPMVADSLGGAWRTIPFPDSIAVSSFEAAPDGRRAVFTGRAGGPWLLLATTLEGGESRRLATLPQDWLQPGVSWAGGDSIAVVRWADGEDAPALWWTRFSGGPMVRGPALPVPCAPISTQMSRHSSHGICQVRDFRYDIWVYRVPDVTP